MPRKASPGTPSRLPSDAARAALTRSGTSPRAREDAAIDRVLARDKFIVAGGRQRREIALTFDDGPSIYTPRLMAVLRHFHAPATFFEIGQQIPRRAATTRSQSAAGYWIGDHTETHADLAALRAGAQREQIVAPGQQLGRVGVGFPRLFRPPYGAFNRTTLALLHQLRMLAVLWTIDTNDWRRPGVKAILRAAIGGAQPGAIILMHDGGGERSQTIAALPRIIRALRRRGYKLVSIPRLLLEDPPPHAPRRFFGLSGG